MFTNILVPLDGSPAAEKALPVAAMLARASQGTLTLVRVITICTESWSQPLQHTHMIQSSIETEKQQAIEYLREQAISPLLHTIRVKVDVRWGPVVHSVLEAIQHTNCDLVVLGQKKQRGPLHMFPGSATDHIITNSPIPILLIHEDDPFPVFNNLTKNQAVNLLIGIDDMQHTRRVLHVVESLLAGLAPSIQAVIHLIRVTTPFSIQSESGYHQSMQETIEIIENYQSDRIHTPSETGMAPFDKASEERIRCSVIIESDCVRALVDAAEQAQQSSENQEEGYHIMAISSLFGQPATNHQPILTSIMERLIRETHLPMLIVPPPHGREDSQKATFLGTVYL